MKKIGILLADDLRDALTPQFVSYPEMFFRLLGDKFQYEVFDVRAGETPPTPAAMDGYLITGSRRAVYEELPWIPPLFAYIRQLAAEQIPLLGVCFGHQAVACALGGAAEKSAKGWGVGLQKWPVVGQKSWMQPPLTTLRLLASHQDQVTKLPPGAEKLAGSDFCEYAAFAVGENVFCLQGHPEFSRDYMRALMEFHRDGDVTEEHFAAATNSIAKENDSQQCAQWMQNFFAR